MAVHGTARFAERVDLEKAKLVRNRAPGEFPEGLMVGWWFEDMYDFVPIEYAGDQHQLIVAGTGGGKFTTGIAPMLLGSRLEDSTVVVVDPKGEVAQVVGPYFQKPFADHPTVHLLDPWDLCGTGRTSVLNVLDDLNESNPNYVDDARALADAMVIPSGEKNTHWDNAARNLLTALLLYVALSPKEQASRHLRRVRELVTMVWEMPKAYPGPKRQTLGALLFELRDSKLADGAVARAATAIWNREEKERSGIISSIDRDTSWMDSPQMLKVLQGKSLDLKEAARGGHKYFVVLPPEFSMTHRAWLRLMVTAFAKAFKRNTNSKLPALNSSRRWRHIVIDEFANLGEMGFILNEVAVARGYDVKYHLIVQDLSQLANVYKTGWESFINNSFQRFFAVSDMFTAEYVSRMLGTTTVQAVSQNYSTSGGTSYGTNDGISRGESRSSGSFGSGSSHSTSYGDSRGSSFNDSEGWSRAQSVAPTPRPLQTPDEVRRLEEDWQFLFFRGQHGIKCWKPAYWEVFPSLPKYSLKEVLGTVGRKPKDQAELNYFTSWRAGTLLMRPHVRAEAAASLPKEEQQALPPPEAKRGGLRWKLVGGIAVLAALVWWLMPSARRAPEPSPTEPRAEITPQKASLPPPPPLTAYARLPVPNKDVMNLLPAGPATRDFLLDLMDKQAIYCVPGRGAEELKLMEYLTYWATVKRADTNKDAAYVERQSKYGATFRRYLEKPVWTDSDASTMFSMIQTSIKFGLVLEPEFKATLQKLFGRGACPLTKAAPTRYEPPVYADASKFQNRVPRARSP
jgi:type IV secretion system protein VirD4